MGNIVKEEVIETIAQANKMAEKLKETLAFFDAHMEELTIIKEALITAQEVGSATMLNWPDYEEEIRDQLSNLDWFINYEKDLRELLNATRPILPGNKTGAL